MSLITESVWEHIKIKCPEKVLTSVTVDFGECVIRRSSHEGSEIIHKFEITEHIEKKEVVQVHILRVVEVSDSSESVEAPEKQRKKYENNSNNLHMVSM